MRGVFNDQQSKDIISKNRNPSNGDGCLIYLLFYTYVRYDNFKL